MRINVYSQELLTDMTGLRQLETVTKKSDTGVVYSAVRLYLASPDELHHTFDDDDRSAITFWLPQSGTRRAWFAANLDTLAEMVREAEPETGMD
jgi:hypothetical protein